ncbi:transcription termination/antitermination protein NusG [Psychromarinibacter halotolerans]|uniref:Transcription termination/antitermination protein NusG n=1 Tax=Psychromarinibacter halotolerans TaxID=1775175 RepID=A0ABV7GYN3_9RHOB|nr:transcription termination/antitermination NusG family protein [Psychromarinibacter halotolerans]MDF0598976.1 transcription termination/antitermination NusG family protein [Psychromarinibacter halotolerans]
MTRHWLEVEVGDVAEPGDRDGREIVRLGVPRWYALRCRPQRENAAERWLSERGVYAFHPVTSRVTQVKGTRREVTSCYLPGYVFARFPGEPVGHRVLGSPFISDALRTSSGQWGILGVSKLRRLHDMRRVDQAIRQRQGLEAKKLRAARQLKSGDRALFKAGVFAGFDCEIVAVDKWNGAKVRLELFGREALVSASPDDLVKLSG